MTEEKYIVNGGNGDAMSSVAPAELSSSMWFVAIVNNRSEKMTAEKLGKMGIETYVPVQTVFKVWKNGRKAKVDKIAIPAVVFVHCTEQERREIVKMPFIFRFMTNKAASAPSGGRSLAVVSDGEIGRLRFMLGQSDVPVTITDRPYEVGDRVRVIRGSLAGLEGEVFGLKPGKSELVVLLENFGCAKLEIDTLNIELLK